MAYALIWWLVLGAIGLIAFPLTSRICVRLPDRGYSISKLVGLVVMTYIVWLLPSLKIMKFGYGVIVVSLLILAGLSFSLGWKRLKIDRSLLRSMILSEAIFIFSFTIFSFITYRKPDIYFLYSDDFVHFGFFNSILRADYFPPPDPWFAGNGLEYYYGGHLMMAIVTLLSRVPHVIAYELSIPTIFALALVAAYGLGYNITNRKLYGALSAFFVAGAGYITGVFELVSYFSGHSDRGFIDWMLSFDFTRSNWLIPNTATFYPYFGLLKGDMSGMSMAMPFPLLVISLVLALFRQADIKAQRLSLDSLLLTLVLGLSLGFLSLIHSWDYPIYLLFVVLAFVLLKIRPLWAGGATVALSLVLYLPYYFSRGTGAVQGIGFVTEKTQLDDFLLIFSLFLFVLLSLLYLMSKDKALTLKTFLPATVSSYMLAWMGHFPILLILLPIVLGAVYYIYTAGQKGEREFILLLLTMGALLGLMGDSFFVDDVYGPPLERFNTLMRLHMSIWFFWGVASAVAIPLAMRYIKGVTRTVWAFALVFLILASLVHPLLSTIGWASGHQPIYGPTTSTLDGFLYLQRTEPGDYYAIRWLNENIKGSPVILEAPGNPSSYTSRVSALTGLPTVVGWRIWETVWRGDWGEPERRGKDTDAIYNTIDIGQTSSLLRKYNVEYIYIGGVEAHKYSNEGLSKFALYPEDYPLVYDEQGVRIYKVVLSQ